jgi:ribonucleotide reductase alpha subunit
MIKNYFGIEIDLSRDQSLDQFALDLLEKYYMKKTDTSPQEAFARAALAYSDGDLELAQRVYDYASKGWFMYSSPVLSNAPDPNEKMKALPISCFLTYLSDDLEGLIEHTSELRWLSVKGGGVGGHWSDIRSVSDIAPGPIPFLKTVDADMTAYRQGKTRKGSYAAYLDISHPDVEEFMNFRVPTGGDPNRKCFNLHNAINITDEFMEAVSTNSDWHLRDPNDSTIRNTVNARDLWQRILEIRFRTGEPYLNFIDEANRHLPEPLKKIGLKIHGSNLCVTGDQRVPTNRGLLTAKELYEQGGNLTLFDNQKCVESTPMMLIEKNSPVYKITLANGMTHTITDYHKVKTLNGDVACKDLKLGDSVATQTNVGVFGQLDMPDEAFLLGLYQADKFRNFQDQSIPDWIWESNEKTQWKYVKALYYVYGTVNIGKRKENPICLSIAHMNKSFLQELQLLLSNLGINNSLHLFKGELREAWRLVIRNKNDALVFEKHTGFLSRKNVTLEDRKYRDNTKKYHKIIKIEYVGKEDVYCLTVNSQEHYWVCNGIITLNCNEIHLPTSKERTAVCCLSSLNLEKYDEWKNTTIVADLIRFLDNVLQVFIDNAPSVRESKIFSRKRKKFRLGGDGISFLSSKKYDSLGFKFSKSN